MARFRNPRGMEFELEGRWADHARTRKGITELGDDGEPTGSTAPAISESELAKVRKADLQQMLRDAGEEVDESWTKAELSERLRIAHGDHA